MKIAFLSFYSGQVDRGVEVATRELAKGLTKSHQVTIFQAGDRVENQVDTVILKAIKNWLPDTSSSWLRFLYLDYYSRKIWLFTWKFIPYFFKHRYDVVIPTNGGWQVVICRLATWMLRKKLLVQGNAGIGRDDTWQAWCFPDYFIAISPQGHQWIKRKLLWGRSTYIPYGVDIEKFNQAQAIRIGLKRPIVLCVSAFLPYKRIELLIKAMQHVPKASLLLIGQGPLEEQLRTLGHQLLEGRFMIKTKVKHYQLIKYYKSANVFSLPSRSTEALGMVNIEALASGLPIVAPDDDNRRQIVGDTGIFVDVEDIGSYAKAISKALQADKSKQSLKQAQKYSWDKIVNKYNEVLAHI